MGSRRSVESTLSTRQIQVRRHLQGWGRGDEAIAERFPGLARLPRATERVRREASARIATVRQAGGSTGMAREDKESTHEEIGSSAESFTGTVNTGGGATYFGTRILPYPDPSTVSELRLCIRTPVVSGFQLRIRDACVYTDTLRTAACIRTVCGFLANCMGRSRDTGTRVSKYHRSTSRVLEI